MRARAENQKRQVHELRIAVKKLRALVRLLGPSHLAHAEKMNRSLAAVGQELSPARDAAVRAKWLKEHGFKTQRQVDPVLKTMPLQRRVELARGELLAQLPMLKKKHIKKHLMRCAEKMEKAAQRAAKKKSPEHFHEWRKRAKDYFYQLELTGSRPPERLEKLTKALGRAQDCVLVEGSPLPDRVKKTAKKERKRLWKKALRHLH